MSEATATSIASNNQLNIRIYPNPAQNYITIEGLDKINSIEIIDITGKIVTCEANSKIDISTLNEGVYFVKITTEENIHIKKIYKK